MEHVAGSPPPRAGGINAPYNWGGSGPSDCSGDMAKRVRQHNEGMSIEDITRSAADDYAKVLERLARDG